MTRAAVYKAPDGGVRQRGDEGHPDVYRNIYVLWVHLGRAHLPHAGCTGVAACCKRSKFGVFHDGVKEQ